MAESVVKMNKRTGNERYIIEKCRLFNEGSDYNARGALYALISHGMYSKVFNDDFIHKLVTLYYGRNNPIVLNEIKGRFFDDMVPK